jgi:hypothetical protein
MKAFRLLISGVVLGFSLATVCAGPPKSFQKVEAPKWVTFEVRDGLEFDRAWNTVFDIIINDFDLEMVLKEDGYIRTAWLHSYGGVYLSEYRVRITVRFTPDHKGLKVKTEAHVKDGDKWIIGVDSRLVSTLKTDLMGTIGRTTR